MSNITKDTLHELIKHMSKSEKRYFKVLSSRHTIGEENNYILLFDFIDAQKEYDQDAIFNHFKNETFLNKFSITKNVCMTILFTL
jgi:3-methyladenine DNA glycosylase AlkD